MLSIYVCLCARVYCVRMGGGRGEAWLIEREVSWGNGRWESQEGWWRGQRGEGVCRTHEHGVCHPICSEQDRDSRGQGPQRGFAELSEPAHAQFIW